MAAVIPLGVISPADANAVLLPLAHAGHWLWALYLPPVLIVVGSIVRTMLTERKQKPKASEPSASDRGEGGPR